MTTIPENFRVAAIYNPQTQSKTQLIENFVVRQKTFQRLFSEIKEAKMEVPEQHYLIQGRRGMGKTTLLLRLAYEVENDAELNTWLVPVVFNEEEYGIRRLFNFWERILELLAQKLPEMKDVSAQVKQLSHSTKDDDAYERALFELLSGELKRTGKKLLLFFDNFGDMVRKLSPMEAHRLRKILQTYSDLRIFAASAIVLEAFYQYDHPFYEFFKVTELKGLDKKETRDLLTSLSNHYKNDQVAQIIAKHPGRVEALRRLSGGVTRTIVLLFEIFADDNDGSAFHDLEMVLDRTTPLYKHRMDDLSDQQQAIVESIALNWDAITVKEIAEHTRLESKIISAQLQSLEKNGIVEKIPTKTKNHLYIISERFFNIWFLMRHGRRGDEKRVLWLVRFLEAWCDKEILGLQVDKLCAALEKGNYAPDAALLLAQALMNTQELSAEKQHQVRETTSLYLQQNAPELSGELKKSDLDTAFTAMQLWFNNQQTESISLMQNILPKFFDNETIFQIHKSSQEIGIRPAWEFFIGPLAFQIAIKYNVANNTSIDKKEKFWKWCIAYYQKYLLPNNPYSNDQEIRESDQQILAACQCSLGILLATDEKRQQEALQLFKQSSYLGNDYAISQFIDLSISIQKNDTSEILQLLTELSEKNRIGAKLLLCMYYFHMEPAPKANLPFKIKALHLSEEILSSRAEYPHLSLHGTLMLLWNNQVDSSKRQLIQYIADNENTLAVLMDLTLTLFLAKNQAPWLLELFNSPEGEKAQLKDRFKPIYYAVLKKLDHPDFLRMGEELKETVDEILAKANQMAIDYA
ncbi:MAG: hypothetical protein IT219_12210 [Bacteroidales bacterium]|nr:hypothetical protein [Bacteroidales bacterium]